MAFETKEQVLEKILSTEKPDCPHCGQVMSLWEVPTVAVCDGLGWGTPYLYVCFNDSCPLYRQGWENIRENYGRNASYRCMRYPDTDRFECLPVFSPFGATGQIIDDQVLAEAEVRKEAIKQGFKTLAECYAQKDWKTVLTLLQDSVSPERVRLKAADIIGDIGELEAVEPLRNHQSGVPSIEKKVHGAVERIHERHFTRECPFCAEIIKNRAAVCKHCGKDVSAK